MSRARPRVSAKQKQARLERLRTWGTRGAILAAALSLPVVVYFGADALITSDAFLVEDVLIEGNRQVSDDAIRAAAGLLAPRNLLTCDAEAMEAAVSAVPWIQDVDVEISRNGIIAIRVVEAELFAVATLGLPRLIDVEGQVIGELDPSDSPDAPYFVGFEREQEGELVLDLVAFEEAKTIMGLIAPLQERLGRVREVHYSALVGFRLVFEGGLDARIGNDRFEERVARLVQTLDVLTAEEQTAASIVIGSEVLDRVAVRLVDAAPAVVPGPEEAP
jgi:cell division septal protein FtsQ